MCNTSNKYQHPNNLAEYQHFYARDFISLLHFEKKVALSMANIFRNIQLLTLQINTDFLINQLNFFFTQDTLHCSLIASKNLRSLLQKFSERSTIFLPVFTVDEVCNISNKYRSAKNLLTHWYFYIRDFITLLLLEDSLKIHLFFFTKSNLRSLSQRLLETFSFDMCLLVQ